MILKEHGIGVIGQQKSEGRWEGNEKWKKLDSGDGSSL